MASDKPVSVTELKTFIDAVEFASDAEDWIPSARQWTRIRAMIERLEETAAAPAPMSYGHPQQYGPPPQMMQLPQPMMAPGGMMGGPQAPQMMAPNAPFMGDNPAARVRTPDIDTNGKPYQSAFA